MLSVLYVQYYNNVPNKINTKFKILAKIKIQK